MYILLPESQDTIDSLVAKESAFADITTLLETSSFPGVFIGPDTKGWHEHTISHAYLPLSNFLFKRGEELPKECADTLMAILANYRAHSADEYNFGAPNSEEGRAVLYNGINYLKEEAQHKPVPPLPIFRALVNFVRALHIKCETASEVPAHIEENYPEFPGLVLDLWRHMVSKPWSG